MLIANLFVLNTGLTDEQLRQLFIVLENKPDASAIYEKWIDSIPRRMVDLSIRSYKGSSSNYFLF